MAFNQSLFRSLLLMILCLPSICWTVQEYLVDTSGSMDGSQKDQLCSQVENQSINYLFAFGDNIRGQYQQVFGHIDQVTDEKLDRVLKDIKKRIDQATQYDQKLGTMTLNITQLDTKDLEAEKTLHEAEKTIESLQKKVESAQQGTKDIKKDVSSLKNEILPLKESSEKEKLNKKLSQANVLWKQLEVKQIELLSKCEFVLGNIELQKIELGNIQLQKIELGEKKKSEIAAQGSKVDDATTTAKNGLTDIEELLKKLKDMNSKLKDAENNFLENVLEQIIELSKDLRNQAMKQKNRLKDFMVVQKKIVDVKNGLKQCQFSLDESKSIANEEIDNLLQILS